MGRQRDAWEDRLRQAGMPAHIGYEPERRGERGLRDHSLNAFADHAEAASELAVWDEYDLGEANAAVWRELDAPPEIQAIYQKLALGEAMTPTERQRKHRFEAGTFTGTPGRPRKA